MTDRILERMGAACGILYVVLLMAGPSIGGPTSRVAFSLEILGFLSFLFFLGSLWSALRRAEGGSGWLSATAFGAGLMSVTIKVASAAPVLAARYRADGLDPRLQKFLSKGRPMREFIAWPILSFRASLCRPWPSARRRERTS